jgi:hypothetical protein
MTEHRDEWVSYCSHYGDDGDACRCAPDVREVVGELEQWKRIGMERNRMIADLRALIENAPHQDLCSTNLGRQDPCDCWKSQSLFDRVAP